MSILRRGKMKVEAFGTPGAGYRWVVFAPDGRRLSGMRGSMASAVSDMATTVDSLTATAEFSGGAPDAAPTPEADTGGNDVITTCPFCGSGQVVGRSDGDVECGFCDQVFIVELRPTFSGTPRVVDGEVYEGHPNGERPGVDSPDADPSMGEVDPAMTPGLDPTDPAALDADPEAPDDGTRPHLQGDQDDEEQGDDPKKPKGGLPDFLSSMHLRTASGQVMDADSYLARIARIVR